MAGLRTVLLGALLVACSSVPAPFADSRDCRISDGCDEALAAAAELLQDEAMETPSNVVVMAGRTAGGFHAEVHLCVGDGRYWLVDVIGPDKSSVEATLRETGWADPPCD